MGINDQGDPNICTLLGDSPGSLGLNDYADTTLARLIRGSPFMASIIGRTKQGEALSLSSKQVVPIAGAASNEKLTKEQLAKIFSQASSDYLKSVADELNTDLAKYGLDTVLRRAHFFAQVRQEGGAALEANVESLNYAKDGLKGSFKYYRLHPKEAEADAREKDAKTHKITHAADQETIANNAYANRNGNGDKASGDGWNFRGRGLIQVTGRSNYAAATKQYRVLYGGTDVDFEVTPALMAEFPYTVRSAVCFWIQHGLQKLADVGETDAAVDSITTVINSQTDSFKARRDNFKTAFNAFK